MTSLEAHEKVEFESGPAHCRVRTRGRRWPAGLYRSRHRWPPRSKPAAPLVGQPGKPADGRGQDQVVTIPGRRCGRSQRMEGLDPVGKLTAEISLTTI